MRDWTFDKSEIKTILRYLLDSTHLESMTESNKQLLVSEICSREPDRYYDNGVSRAEVYSSEKVSKEYVSLFFTQQTTGVKECSFVSHVTPEHYWTDHNNICLHDSYVIELNDAIYGGGANKQHIIDTAMEAFLPEYDIELYHSKNAQVLGNLVGIEIATIDTHKGRDIYHYVSFLPYEKFKTSCISAVHQDIMARIAQLKSIDYSDTSNVQTILRIHNASDDKCVKGFMSTVIVPTEEYIDINDEYYYK
jgi:hypothetical protein